MTTTKLLKSNQNYIQVAFAFKVLLQNMIAIHLNNEDPIDKPVYIGFAILEECNLLLYET